MPERLMREPTSDRVPRNAFRTTPTAPLVRLDNTALQHSPIRLKTLPHGLQAKLIKVAEHGHIRGGEGSVGHVEVFRMEGVGTSIIGRPRPLPGHRHTQPNYTLKCEEPV